uniref:Peroxidase n=1 Tax=Kalanchoe fedtschenkoi TaxID=63787 RepID=A0A7N0RFR9_KALFE
MTPAAVALVLILALFARQSYAALTTGFYKGKCGSLDVEAIVAQVMSAQFAKDPTIVPALLRMHFHDCFVNGCDASILLDGSTSEKTASPNQSVRGYEVIDAVKAELERRCPGLVSCADIIAMATRDVVVLGKGTRYEVQTGRRDGIVSRASDANANLPGPSVPVSQLANLFANKGLNVSDMAVLLGAHTVGITHCSFIVNRLYNFQNTGRPYPSMDAALANQLRQTCPQVSVADNPVNLDQNASSSNTVDKFFYNQIQLNRGVLHIDQAIAQDSLTRPTVTSLASGAVEFKTRFGQAMVKMGAIQVLSGKKGEIRRTCRARN